MSLQRSLLFTVFLAPGALPALAADGDFAGTVDIGGGRKMYLECRGTGSPTVFIVPGGRAAADEWTERLARLRRCREVHAGLRLRPPGNAARR